jgi:creatinine amidohydrolase/Fe(II)-dependent formamide hydrolase-like protein
MDTVGSLAHHGIKRFVFLNGHGGNTNILNLALQLAKRKYRVMSAAPDGPSNTEMAQKYGNRQKRFWDVHSGPSETGLALLLFEELIEMWRLEGWETTLKVDDRLRSFLNPDREDHEMVSQLYRACVQPNSDDFTSSGVWGLNDPNDADPAEAKIRSQEKIDFVADFIRLWKTIPLPPAFKD